MRSDEGPSDPHAEYRRQAAQYFGTTSAEADARTEGLIPPADRRVQFEQAGQPQPNWHRAPGSAAPLSEQPSVRFALQPWHALWALAAVCALAAVFFSSTVGWILLALISAGGGWYARSRNASWPPDVRDMLAHRRLASLGPGTASPPTATPSHSPATGDRWLLRSADGLEPA